MILLLGEDDVTDEDMDEADADVDADAAEVGAVDEERSLATEVAAAFILSISSAIPSRPTPSAISIVNQTYNVPVTSTRSTSSQI